MKPADAFVTYYALADLLVRERHSLCYQNEKNELMACSGATLGTQAWTDSAAVVTLPQSPS
ncbi:MAG TPA: hypothetical protein VJ673_13645 [Aromatoleum sp.]|uniref:hypothetical protein n=1 Tax=Aromatoleum sp. TaxID=2307007 RepID=UPI002B47531A|nr:hypothetical protein [Aromatoleum sp.]HJV26726.1 hypothetical protein [Aromatoleum sp.]